MCVQTGGASHGTLKDKLVASSFHTDSADAAETVHTGEGTQPYTLSRVPVCDLVALPACLIGVVMHEEDDRKSR